MSTILEMPFPVRRLGLSGFDVFDERDADGVLVYRCLAIDAYAAVPLPLRGQDGQQAATQVVVERIVVPFGGGAWDRLALQLVTGEKPPEVATATAETLRQLMALERQQKRPDGKPQ